MNRHIILVFLFSMLSIIVNAQIGMPTYNLPSFRGVYKPIKAMDKNRQMIRTPKENKHLAYIQRDGMEDIWVECYSNGSYKNYPLSTDLTNLTYQPNRFYYEFKKNVKGGKLFEWKQISLITIPTSREEVMYMSNDLKTMIITNLKSRNMIIYELHLK